MGKGILGMLYGFAVFSFVITLIETKDFSFLNEVPLTLSFDPKRGRVFTINYFLLIGIAVAIYSFIALLSLNIFGSGLSDSAIVILKNVSTIALMYSITVPLANLLLANAGAIGSAIGVLYQILFVFFSIKGMGAE